MSTKNLETPHASLKLKELAESIDFAMLCTELHSYPFHAIPMSTKRVDADGAVWFLSGQDSTHNANIAKNSRVALIYAEPRSMRFLSIYGDATIHKEVGTLQSLYQASDGAWFKGLDDPNLTALKISPDSAYYWDVEGNKLTALWRMGVAIVTGAPADLGTHGEMKI